MSYGYDAQLIDTVAVRRRRLETAFVCGDQRMRRAWSDRLRTFVLAGFVTVLAAAGCVAVSFVTSLLTGTSPVAPGVVTPASQLPTPGPTPGPSWVTPVPHVSPYHVPHQQTGVPATPSPTGWSRPGTGVPGDGGS